MHILEGDNRVCCSTLANLGLAKMMLMMVQP